MQILLVPASGENCFCLPVIIPPGHYGWWLKNHDLRSESHRMTLERVPDEPLKIYLVSDLGNSPKTDDARCIEPVRIDPDFSSGSGGEMKGKAESLELLLVDFDHQSKVAKWEMSGS